MLSDQELEAMRADQQALMTDTVSIVREQGRRWDEEAQQTIETWEAIYSGPGRLVADPAGTQLGADGALRPEHSYLLTVPHTVQLRPGDRVSLENGMTVWVQQVQKNSFGATATRAQCSLTQGAA